MKNDLNAFSSNQTEASLEFQFLYYALSLEVADMVVSYNYL